MAYQNNLFSNVSDTSRSAYSKHVKYFRNKLFFKIKTIILENINDVEMANKGVKGITRDEIAVLGKMEKSTVSGRVNEMIKAGILETVGKRKSIYSKITSYTVSLKKDYGNTLL